MNTSDKSYCSSLESFVACRLIILNKNPGLRLTGVGEVLRTKSEKAVMIINKQDAMKAGGQLQNFAWHVADAEVAIHTVQDIFKIKIQILNRNRSKKIMLQNTSVFCPIVFTYINNYCKRSAHLFIV